MAIIIHKENNVYNLYSITHSDNIPYERYVGILKSLDNILETDIEYPMLDYTKHFEMVDHIPEALDDPYDGILHDYVVYELNKKSSIYHYLCFQIAQTNAIHKYYRSIKLTKIKT